MASSRGDDAFLISQGAARTVYYVGALFFLFHPTMRITRGAVAWLIGGLYTPKTWVEFYAGASVIILSAGLAFVLTLYLSKAVAKLLSVVSYLYISLATLVFIVSMVYVLTGLTGILLMLVAGAVGFAAMVFNTRLSYCLGALILPVLGKHHGLLRVFNGVSWTTGWWLMRGWTHYFSGLVMASFFPQLLSDLAKGVMWPVLAGVAGYLPDFLDFKFKKWFWKIDLVVDPAPRDPLRKISPRRARISELRALGKWRFFYIEGVIQEVLEERDGFAKFKVSDDTGSITVVARDKDYYNLTRILGMRISEAAKTGRIYRFPGYLDAEENGEVYWNIADAPHPQYIASAVAEAIDRAYETARMVTVKIHNIRMPGDFYRRFLVHYDEKNRRIIVVMGPLVSTGGLPLEGSDPPEYRKIGVAETKYPFRKVYPRPTIIDAFSGPEIGYEKGWRRSGGGVYTMA
jgi:hypothetical protein